MMFRRIHFILAFAGFGMMSAGAQNRTVSFFDNEPWEQVVEEAKLSGKLIFMDCYTQWCGPCKVLDAKVFTDDSVADHFNAAFINAKYDMEKGDGITLRQKYDVAAYPTLLFIDPETEKIVYRTAGAGSPEWLIEQANNAFDPGAGVDQITARYEQSGKSASDLGEYIRELKEAGMFNEVNRAVTSYFEDLTDEEMVMDANWNLLKDHVADPLSPALQRINSDREYFSGQLGTGAVDQLLMFAAMKTIASYQNLSAEPAPDFDYGKFEQLKNYVKNMEGSFVPSLLLQLKAVECAQESDYDGMLEALEEIGTDESPVPSFKAVFIATHLNKLSGRHEFRQRALKLIDEMLEASDDSFSRSVYTNIRSVFPE